MVEALGISLKEFIFYLIDFSLLVFILGHFLYKPFLANLDKRKETIAQDLQNAKDASHMAEQKLEEYEERIRGAEEESKAIVRTAKKEASQEAKEIVSDAGKKAEEIIKKAEKEIEEEKSKALEQLREEIADLAMLAATRIVEEDVAREGRQDEIIDNIIKEAGESSWQN